MSEVDRIWDELEQLQLKVNKEFRLMNERLNSIEKSQKETIDRLEAADRRAVNRDPFVSRGGSVSV